METEKKRPGRPAKSADEKRVSKGVMMSQEAWEQLAARAERLGIPQGRVLEALIAAAEKTD